MCVEREHRLCYPPAMDYTVLGRTGLRAGVMGLGCGGHSRLGMAAGQSEDHAADLVRRALDLGVNFIDTAECYETEQAVGKGIAGRRDDVLLATKFSTWPNEGNLSAADLARSLEDSLRKLGTNRVDLYQLHGVPAGRYERLRDELAPEMLRQRDAGKIRFLGITEGFSGDTKHDMLLRAVEDDCWDVMMVGFNLLNPCAQNELLPKTIAKNIGVLVMFAVRNAMSNPEKLAANLRKMRDRGCLGDSVNEADALDWLVREGHATSIPEAAYRFCRHEPGCHVVLSGTGNAEHLAANAAALAAGPLPEAALRRLREMFGRCDCVSGD